MKILSRTLLFAQCFLAFTFANASEESHKDSKAYKACQRYQQNAKECHSQLLNNPKVGFLRGIKCTFGSTNPACDSFLHITDPNYCFEEQSKDFSRYMILYDGEKNTCYVGVKNRGNGRIYLHIYKNNDYFARDEFGRQEDLIKLLKGSREALETRANTAREIYTSELESLKNKNSRESTPNGGTSSGASGGTQ